MAQYNAGYTSGAIEDTDRSTWDGSGPRRITWSMWYPAERNGEAIEQQVGPPGRPYFTNGPVVPSAPLSEARPSWPLVLMSHGTGGSALGMGWFGRRLAEAGYVVLGANHHGNTAEEPYRAEGFWCWWERSRDLTCLTDFALDRHAFKDRLDPDRVFASGHSLGGHTVLASAGARYSIQAFQSWLQSQPDMRGPREFPDLADHLDELERTSAPFRASLERHALSYRDPRFRAVFAMAPAPTVRGFSPDSLGAISIPVHIQTGAADAECPVETCTNWLGDQNSGFGIEILPGEVGHYVYLSEALAAAREDLPEISKDPPSVNRAAIHEHAAQTAIRLFQATS